MKNNNLEKIYNKLPKDKTLLKAELRKVELALADDIKGVISELKAKRDQLKKAEKAGLEFRKRMDGIYKEGGKLEKVLEKQRVSGMKLVNKTIKLAEKAEKAAKDLGVDPNNIGGYKELDSLGADVEIDSVAVEEAIRDLYA